MSSCQSTQSSNVSVDYYQISGDSVEALDEQIRTKGPRLNGGEHAVAVARIRMIPNFQYRPDSAGCSVKSAKVNVDAKVTLPNWIGRKSADKQMAKAWDNIDRYTRLHESYHVALAFRYAKIIENEVLAQSPQSNCDMLRDKSIAIFKTRLAEHETAQRDFDRSEQDRFAQYAKKSGSRLKIVGNTEG